MTSEMKLHQGVSPRFWWPTDRCEPATDAAGEHGTVHAAHMDYDPTEWPASPRIPVRSGFALRNETSLPVGSDWQIFAEGDGYGNWGLVREHLSSAFTAFPCVSTAVPSASSGGPSSTEQPERRQRTRHLRENTRKSNTAVSCHDCHHFERFDSSH